MRHPANWLEILDEERGKSFRAGACLVMIFVVFVYILCIIVNNW